MRHSWNNSNELQICENILHRLYTLPVIFSAVNLNKIMRRYQKGNIISFFSQRYNYHWYIHVFNCHVLSSYRALKHKYHIPTGSLLQTRPRMPSHYTLNIRPARLAVRSIPSQFKTIHCARTIIIANRYNFLCCIAISVLSLAESF